MESVDFYEVFAGKVTCPMCGWENELDVCESRHQTGEEVTCYYCKYEFILGESL